MADEIHNLEVDYAIYQLEEGENGTPHYQGYLILSTKKALSHMRNAFAGEAHWEIARGTPSQNRTYCSKEPRIGDVCEIGVFPENAGQGARPDLKALHEALKAGLNNVAYRDEFFGQFLRYPKLIENYELAGLTPRNEEEDFQSFLLIGPAGFGKSRFARVLARRLNGGSPGYVHNATKWFDGYRGERAIIFDDFRGSSLPFTLFKRVCDRYPFLVEIKGSHGQLGANRFIFTTNTEPTTWWKEEVTHAENGAIFRRLGKVLWFREINSFSFFPDYRSYSLAALVPRRDGENYVETPLCTLRFDETDEEVIQNVLSP